jgi:hypothetical protein
MITKGGVETPCASVAFKITEGPCKDKTIKFEVTKWDAKNNIFTFNKLRVLGWAFKSPKTIREDIMNAAKAGKTVRIQARWVEFGDGFWAVDKIAPNEAAARAVRPASDDTDALMVEMMEEAQRSDEEYRASRGQRGSGGEAPGSSVGEAPGNGDTEQKAGDPCADCGSPMFRSKDDYLTCSNGHDVIPF